VVPPLVGVAVKVTLVPAHIVPDGTAPMLTLAGRLGFTVIVIPLLVEGEPVAHAKLVVMTQVITSP